MDTFEFLENLHWADIYAPQYYYVSDTSYTSMLFWNWGNI